MDDIESLAPTGVHVADHERDLRRREDRQEAMKLAVASWLISPRRATFATEQPLATGLRQAEVVTWLRGLARRRGQDHEGRRKH